MFICGPLWYQATATTRSQTPSDHQPLQYSQTQFHTKSAFQPFTFISRLIYTFLYQNKFTSNKIFTVSYIIMSVYSFVYFYLEKASFRLNQFNLRPAIHYPACSIPHIRWYNTNVSKSLIVYGNLMATRYTHQFYSSHHKYKSTIFPLS